uniref:Uncharacterized protein LOC100184264 n=1 Tax=Phallusia mammillata TaxID=59560 RepID=A0A6F9DI90_9ASCI|nr:uncharacterized protein LOC100184264 [Phallusia mammillata]
MFKDIFTELNAQKMLMHSSGGVADEFKRNGLIETSRELTKETARRLGCDYEIAVVANAHWAKSTAKKNDPWTREIAFCDYVDPETYMRPNLELSPVHTHARIVYRKVHPFLKHVSKL